MKNEVIEKLNTFITAAFAFVAGLAWNESIKAIFTKIFGTPSHIVAMLSYAVIVTIIAVIFTIIIGRAAEKAKTLELNNLKELHEKNQEIIKSLNQKLKEQLK